MTSTDPRHGTIAGYNRIPCREQCCKDAMARYRRGRDWDHLSGRPRIIDATGTRRRLEALMWLGWSRAVVGRRAGVSATNMTRLRNATTVTTATAARIADVYDELSMSLPTGSAQAIANVQNLARRRGYLPPLAWDDDTIDDPDFSPRNRSPKNYYIHEQVDPVVVERVLAGDTYLHTTVAEKNEIMRRWKASGRSERSLCEATGWKDGRYGKASEVADAC
jgi:hypothetical protein